MAEINSNSLAPALGISGKNVPQAVEASVLKRKILAIGTYDPALTSVVAEIPKRILSAEHAGSLYGFGFMIHRICVQLFKSASSVEIYAQPQAEASGGGKAEGSIKIDTAADSAGTFYFYIAGISVPVNIASTDTAAEIAAAIITAVNANSLLPVTALVDGTTAEKVNITAKSQGEYWGNNITIDTNIYNEEDIGALSYTIADMASGSGTPDITDALDALGTGTAQNSDNYTDVIHGYGPVTAVLDKIQTYNGIADSIVGNFNDTVHKPFRSVNSDVVAGSAGLSALITFGNARKETDRTSGTIPVPGSASHPVEIASLAIGYMANKNNQQAELSYRGIILDGIHPGSMADRWTNQYATGRDAAAQAGISCTVVDGGIVKMQNALTYYHPASIPVNSNSYRNMRNISIIQNIFAAVATEFNKTTWQTFSIVTNLAYVGSTAELSTTKSVSSVKDSWLALFTAFSNRAWIADLDFSINALKESTSVEIRTAGNGFDTFPKFIFSGDGDILDNNIEYDTSFAILNQ